MRSHHGYRKAQLWFTLNLQAAGWHQGSAACRRLTRSDAARSFHVTNAVRRSRWLGIIGSAVGLLALLVSALTYLLPETLLHKPIPQVTEAAGKKEAEAAGQKETGHLIFRIKRLESKSRETSEQRPAGTTWEQALSTAAAALGLLAIAFAVFARHLSRRETAGGYRGHTRRRSHRGPGVVGSGRRGARDDHRQRLSVFPVLEPSHVRRDAVRATAMMALIDSGIGTGRWVCWLV